MTLFLWCDTRGDSELKLNEVTDNSIPCGLGLGCSLRRVPRKSGIIIDNVVRRYDHLLEDILNSWSFF